MKLTKKKLYQLIMEEIDFDKKPYDPFYDRRAVPKGPSLTRPVDHEGKPTNYPEHAAKLTALAKSSYPQAKSLADSLDEPLDIELDPGNMQTFNIQSTAPVEMQHGSWFDYVMSGYSDDFQSPIDMDKFRDYVKGKDEDEAKEIYDQLESERIKLRQKIYINQPRTDYDRRKELEKLYDLDFRDDWMKSSSWEH